MQAHNPGRLPTVSLFVKTPHHLGGLITVCVSPVGTPHGKGARAALFYLTLKQVTTKLLHFGSNTGFCPSERGF